MIRDLLELLWHVGVVVLVLHWNHLARYEDEDTFAMQGSGLAASWRRIERRARWRLIVVIAVLVGLVYHVVVKYACYAHHGYCP